MNRRDIIKAGMSSVALTMVPNAMLKASGISEDNMPMLEGAYTTLVKHGHPKQDKMFLWSVMTVKNEVGFLENINSILSKYSYRSTIKYSSTDRFKLAPAKQIIDFLLKEGGVTFDITVFNGDPKKFRNVAPLALNQKMEDLYKDAVPKSIEGSISSKVEDRYGPSDKYNEKFQSVLGITNNVKNAKFDKIIQVNDLVSGIIYSIFASDNVKSKVKQELSEYLNSRVSFEKTGGSFNREQFKLKNVNL